MFRGSARARNSSFRAPPNATATTTGSHSLSWFGTRTGPWRTSSTPSLSSGPPRRGQDQPGYDRVVASGLRLSTDPKPCATNGKFFPANHAFGARSAEAQREEKADVPARRRYGAAPTSIRPQTSPRYWRTSIQTSSRIEPDDGTPSRHLSRARQRCAGRLRRNRSELDEFSADADEFKTRVDRIVSPARARQRQGRCDARRRVSTLDFGCEMANGALREQHRSEGLGAGWS